MRPIIRVENLSKQYRIGTRGPAYRTLRDALTGFARAPLKRLRRNGHANSETIWALKDVSFEVYPGEVVGIIGRNGAGKSTLLKILSRITEPTTGRVELYGRVGSLLEVGTGFHPELTGRENIYLNGAILGMTRREIDKKFDEIVDFAEIEKFIDTPVKHYSSGMYMRLAFAVAAHLDPGILFIDEVLSVGDAAFQHKCLDKMSEIKQKGCTLMVVSHDLRTISTICDRGIYLYEGRIVSDGSVNQAIHLYQKAERKVISEKKWDCLASAPGNEVVRLRKVRVKTKEEKTSSVFDIRLPIGVEATYDVLASGHILIPNYHFYNELGVHLFAVQDVTSVWRSRPRYKGRYTSTVWIPGNFLSEGNFLVDVAISTHVPSTIVHLLERNVVAFRVIDVPYSDTARGDFKGKMPGLIRPILDWDTTYIEESFENEISTCFQDRNYV